MLIQSIEQLPDMGAGRLLGLDPGTQTIGVAMSDANWTLATPLGTVRRKKMQADMVQLHAMIADYPIAACVVGYPLNMDGSEGPRCQSVRAFVRNLEGYLDVPMLMWDERLSSAAAEDAMLAADLSRQSRAEKVDKVAAALILQAMLDRRDALLDRT